MEVLTELTDAISFGFETLQLQRSPHLVLLSRPYYDNKLKPILSRWMLLWLRARKLPRMSDDEVTEFLMQGMFSKPEVLHKVKTQLGDDHVKMLNLAHDWLQSYLPFTIQKVNRVHYGLLYPADIAQLNAEGVKIPMSRKLTAVPFVAKDVPSRASEFAHPDVLIGRFF